MGSAIALSFPRHYFVKRQGESTLEIKLSEGMPASRRMRSRIVENRFGSPIRTLQVLVPHYLGAHFQSGSAYCGYTAHRSANN
jgi:hypothetical protein